MLDPWAGPSNFGDPLYGTEEIMQGVFLENSDIQFGHNFTCLRV